MNRSQPMSCLLLRVMVLVNSPMIEALPGQQVLMWSGASCALIFNIVSPQLRFWTFAVVKGTSRFYSD